MFFLLTLGFAVLMFNMSFASNKPAPATFLRCEFRENPEGIDRHEPRLSWQLPAIPGQNGQQTTAYHILVATSPDFLKQNQGDLWNSGRQNGAPHLPLPYAGKSLRSFQNCYWKVKVWQNGQEQPWSEVARWSMGVLDAAEWRGDWIGFFPKLLKTDPFAGEWFDAARWIWFSGDERSKVPAEIRFFQKEFSVKNPSEIEWAELLLTANDVFQLSINGKPLSEMVNFDAAAPAPRFNLLPHLKTGQNLISITAEKHAPTFTNKKTAEVAGIIGVLKIKSRSELQTIITDASWQSRKTENDNWTPAADLGGASQHWRQLPGWRQINPSPIFRKEFSINKKITSAKIAISGLGYYELYCNGQRVGENRLDPAFTDYDHRVLYVCYDLTKQLQSGKNALGVMLGNGWYNMHTRATWNFDQAPWRDQPKLRAQLVLTFADGTREIIATDTTWRAAAGPVLRDGIRNGEVFDARLNQPGWNAPDFNETAWQSSQRVAAPKGKLVSQIMPGIQVTETIPPVAISEPQPGIYVVDLGTNLAGWVRIRVKGPAGTRVQLRYSERLDSQGMMNQRLNRRYMYQGPFQTDTYILRGDGTEVWEPRFTYHGFRYVEVTGWPGKLTAEMIEGRAANTAFSRKGSFECSNPLLNQIAKLTDRSYRSNFLGYPTDCPQREKNGWTGDAHLAAEQAMLVYDNLNAYEKWAHDLFDARTPEGDLPGIVPTGGWGYHRDNGPGWGSAAVLIPWYLYLYSGDTQILADHFELMHGYVDFLHQTFPDHIVKMGRGDWCFLHTRTPAEVTSTALFFENTRLVSLVCQILEKNADAARYATLAEEIKTAFQREFYQGNGIYSVGSQTAQALALFYKLVPEAEKAATIAQLVAAVHRANDHVDCGILGAKALFQALSENGEHELAYKIATQPDFPGYGFWISQGTTSLWEDWDDTEGSFNHVMFGDIVTWFYRSLAGINAEPARPGRHFIIQPRPAGDLSFARATTSALSGQVASAWQIKNRKFRLEVTIPPDCEATVILPNGEKHETKSGTHTFEIKYETAPNNSANPMELWYREPAQKWVEALPIGNGRLGAMIYGGAAEDQIQFNEENLWTGEPREYQHEGAAAHLAEVRKLLFEGKQDEAEALAEQEMMSVPLHQKAYQPFGDLYLTFPGHEKFADYRRTLDLQQATARVQYSVDGVTFQRTYFASHPDQALVLHLSADRKAQIHFAARLSSPHENFATHAEADGITLSVQVKNGALRGEARLKIVPHGGTLLVNGDQISLANADSATLFLVAATNYVSLQDVSANPAEKCTEALQELAGKSLSTIQEAHVQDYAQFFDRLKIDLGTTGAAQQPTDWRLKNFRHAPDPQLVALYLQFGRYLLISASRPGTHPATLQGIWNDQLTPPWDSKMTTNINLEMNYWPAESCNLSECHTPLFDLIDDLVITGHKTAQAHYGCRGWVLHHNTDLWRGTAPVNASNHGIWMTGGAWLCQHLWEHFLFTQDRNFLAKQAYPAMKGAAEFFVDFLTPDPKTGWLISTPSNSPEIGGLVAGPTMDHQIIRALFRDCIAAANLLGTDTAFSDTLAEFVGKIAPNQIGRHGQLQEWLEDLDDPTNQHRHVSHLWGLHPGHEITLRGTPELARAARQSLMFRGDGGTGWSLAWKINFWARFGDGDHAFKMITNLLTPVGDPESASRSGGGSYPNLFDAHPPFQIDGNFGAAAGIAEMLLQSHSGEIDILPALPTTLANGQVTGLCARGGFEIDLSWQNGKLTELTVHSKAGKMCHLRYGEKVVRLSTLAGKSYRFDRDLAEIQ